AVGPDFEQPAAPAAERYSAAATPAATAGGDRVPAQRLHAGMDIPAQWWTLFRSPELERLVREALAHSPTLEQARARLLQAQEEFRAESGARTLPSVDANLSGARQKVDPRRTACPSPSRRLRSRCTTHRSTCRTRWTCSAANGAPWKACWPRSITGG